MLHFFLLFMVALPLAPGLGSELPTLYEYYTSGDISSGLSDAQRNFTLNGKEIILYSGAMHYFRIPPSLWRDRLRKARAAGLNAVETYVPWNLHEPRPGSYEFGDGSTGSDFSTFLNIVRFLRIAQEEDLLAIVRPGPYICSEWEFGGLPSWLLRETGIRVRTSDKKYMRHATRYFNNVLSRLSPLQFTKGGPIIAFQIENEYGSTGSDDKAYLNALKNLYRENGINELLFTSDSALSGTAGSVDGALMTANFQNNPENNLWQLESLQPGKPVMTMEYWTGWFDHWSEGHHTRSDQEYIDVLERILKYPASVNLYMFHGGTNWGFMNGANIGDGSTDNQGFQPDTTSYDYDAPLTEAGDYTNKYFLTQELIKRLNPVKTRLPTLPALIPRVAYNTAIVTNFLTLEDMTGQVHDVVHHPTLLPMEHLPINNNSGQQYGYIVYRKTNISIPANANLMISGRVCDTVMVLINGVQITQPLESENSLNGFGYWRPWNSEINLGPKEYYRATLELVVENWGRNNFGNLDQFLQHKGLWQGPVSINHEEIKNWEIIPLEFRTKWVKQLTGWRDVTGFANPLGPALYRAKFTVNERSDTFVDMQNWNKGIVVINGFVLGRYADKIGPQLTLYLPASFLREGENELLIFEHWQPSAGVKFSTQPRYNYYKKNNLIERT